jgi:hypothetical protein
VLRLEDDRVVRTLRIRSFAMFQRELTRLLREGAEVRTVGTREGRLGRGVISLDPLTPGTHDLAMSRLFSLGGYQSLGYVARPGAPSLEVQASAIEPGDYVLWDDDRVTGGTMDAVSAMLPPSVRVRGAEVAIEHDEDEDVVDSRDFLIGADDGGLAVELPDGVIGRAPYLLPYVDPGARASVPYDRVHDFSRRVWELNAKVFAETDLRVADLPSATRMTFRGFDDRMPIVELCRWHAARLQRIRG